MADKLTLEQVETLSVSMLVNILKKWPDTANKLAKLREKNGEGWFVSGGLHFTMGMSIRNELRNKVCYDPDLPGESKNWDDYYIGYLEKALDEIEEEIKKK